MLDKYLEIAHREQEKLASRDRYVELMMKLPEAELHEMAKTGHIKVGYFGSGEILGRSDEGSSWLDHFKGTPLHAQAISLLEEELKMQAADDQRDVMRDQERAQNSQQRDSLRLQKRLLELELVKQQSAAESQAAPPPAPSPGMGVPPGMGAQGAGAPGDMAPEGAVDGNPQKMAEARFKLAFADIEKQAGGVGDFLRAAAPAVGNFVKEHPGAAIGGGLGALHGLFHQGGGVGSALLEGAGGAALGHGAQHAYEGGLGDKLRGMVSKEPPPMASPTVVKEASAEESAAEKKEPKEPLSHRFGRFAGRNADKVTGAIGAVRGAQSAHDHFSAAGHGPKARLAGAAFGAAVGHRVGGAIGRAGQGAVSGASHAHEKKEAAARPLPFVSREKVGAVTDILPPSWPLNAVTGYFGHQRGKKMVEEEGATKLDDPSIAAALLLPGWAGYRIGKHTGFDSAMERKQGKEKQAFGAFLGALGGALAGAGARAAATGALGTAAKGVMSGGLKGLATQGMNWAKSNPLKAVGGAMNAASNFAQARQQGQGVGGAALSGLAGGASALG